MQIRNVTAGLILVGDLPGAQGGSGLSLLPGVDVTLFNEDTEKSVQLNSFITGGQVAIVGTDEPTSGTEVSSASSSVFFDTAGSFAWPQFLAPNADRNGIVMQGKNLVSPANPLYSQGTLYVGSVGVDGGAGVTFLFGASGINKGPSLRGNVGILGGLVYGMSHANSNGANMQLFAPSGNFSGGNFVMGAGESGGDTGANFLWNTGDILGGSSISGGGAATSVTAGQTLILSVNGEAPQTIVFPANLSGGTAIAAEIMTLVSALTAASPSNQQAYTGFNSYFKSGPGKYVLVAQGDQINAVQASLVVSGGTAAVALKLGVSNGGFEGLPAAGGVGSYQFGLGDGGPNTIQCGAWDAIGGFQIFGSPVVGHTANAQLQLISGNGVAAWVLHASDTDGSLNLYDGNNTGKPFSVSSDFQMNAGAGLRVAEGGPSSSMGYAVLSGGSVVVPTTRVTASTRIFLTVQAPGGTMGFLSAGARTPGTSFTIQSSSGSDTSAVAWFLVEPA